MSRLGKQRQDADGCGMAACRIERVLPPGNSDARAGSTATREGSRDEALSERRVDTYNRALKLAELEGLLNDPSIPVDPDRVWVLVGELARPGQGAQ